jgi:hypothetical protein
MGTLPTLAARMPAAAEAGQLACPSRPVRTEVPSSGPIPHPTPPYLDQLRCGKEVLPNKKKAPAAALAFATQGL